MECDTGIRHHSISIHALHEESDVRVQSDGDLVAISIHALHEESDRSRSWAVPYARKFQSTLSMRRATSQHFAKTRQLGISIHALHEESDRI